jgi:hypothetical protein
MHLGLAYLAQMHILHQQELLLFQASKVVLAQTVCLVIPDVLVNQVMLAELVNPVQSVLMVNQV